MLGLFLVAACADTRGGSIPYDKPLAAPDEVTFQTLESEYKIAPMDKLAIKVYKCFCAALSDRLRKANAKLAEARAKAGG